MHLTATGRGKLRATGNGAFRRSQDHFRNAPKRYLPIDIDRSPGDVFKFPGSAATPRESGGVTWLSWPAGFCDPMKLPGTNKARALEVDFAPMPLAGAVERRKWRGDRADGRKENAGSLSSFRQPAGSSTTSTLNFLPSALYSWPVARNSVVNRGHPSLQGAFPAIRRCR